MNIVLNFASLKIAFFIFLCAFLRECFNNKALYISILWK